ncbi:MAG: aspartate/glutamate racemase family protein [Rubrimonas sp.]
MRLMVLNPNTNAATTAGMVALAQETAGAAARVSGATAGFGAPMITDPDALAVAARAVAAAELPHCDAVIVAAFGDPGIEALRDRLAVPVVGLAEAGMAEAAAGGRRFAVATTTPRLVEAITDRAAALGHQGFAGVWLTPGDPVALAAHPVRLRDALADACARAVAEGGAEAVIVGGGPLAEAARTLAASSPAPIVEPLPAAVRLALTRARDARGTAT